MLERLILRASRREILKGPENVMYRTYNTLRRTGKNLEYVIKTQTKKHEHVGKKPKFTNTTKTNIKKRKPPKKLSHENQIIGKTKYKQDI